MAGFDRRDAAVQRRNPSLLAEETWEGIECLARSPTVHAAAGGAARGGSPSSRARPFTPDPTPAHASSTPHARPSGGAAGHSEPSTAPGAATAAAGEAAEPGRGCAGGGEAAGWRRVHSFVCCVTSSPALQSALLSLLLSAGAEDVEAAAGNDGAVLPPVPNLHLTLSQLLALFLRAGFDQASEEVLLAGLWLLESVGSAWRSPASLCLGAYLKHVGLFCPELASRLTATWPASFVKLRAAMVTCQKELLGRLSWRVRPSLQTEVRPCHHWLFRDPRGWAALGAVLAPGADVAAAPLAAPPAAAWDAWSSHMAALCVRLQQRASLARASACQARAGHAEAARGDQLEPLGRPTPEGLPKRQRTQL